MVWKIGVAAKMPRVVRKIVDSRSFYSAMMSVVVVMIVYGIVSPHINLRVLSDLGLFGVSLLTLGFMMARSFSSLLHAILYESLSPRYTGLIGLGLITSCYIMYSFFPTILYPLVRLIEGFAAGLFWPLMQSLLVNGVSPNWRSRMMSVYFLVGEFSGFIGYQVGSLIIYVFGESKLVFTGILVIIAYTIVYSLLAPGKQHISVHKERGKRTETGLSLVLSESRYVKSLVPIILLVGGVNGLMKDYLFAYLKTITGFEETTLRNYWSIIGYSGLLLSLLVSHIQESMRKTKPVLIVSTFFTGSIVFLAFTENPLIVFMILVLVTIGTRSLKPILRGIASNKTSRPEIGIALVNSLTNIAAGTIPFMLGLLSLMI